MASILSLKCISSRAIAGQIWLLPKFKHHLFILYGEESENDFADEAEAIIDDLGLPKILAADLLHDFHGIYEDIEKFMHLITYVKHLQNIPEKWLKINYYLQAFYMGAILKKAINELTLKWDPCGGLDYAGMAKAALKCSRLKDWERFVIARQYCVYDPDISYTYEDYIRVLQNKRMPQFPFNIPAKLQRGTRHRRIGILNILYDFPNSFFGAVCMGNVTAMKYILGKSDAGWQQVMFNEIRVAEVIGGSRLETKSPHILHFLFEKLDQKTGDALLKLCFGSKSSLYTCHRSKVKQLCEMHVWPFCERFTELLLRICKIGLPDSDISVLLRGIGEKIMFYEEHALIPHLHAFWNGLSGESQRNIVSIDPSLKFLTVLNPGTVPHALRLLEKEGKRVLI